MEYLRKQGRISPKDYATALEIALTLNLRLGSLAYQKGLLIRKQVVDVITYQTEHSVLFGEAAIAMGVLSEQQVEELLIEQRKLSVSPYQIMVDRGLITEQDLNQEYNEFIRQEAEEETKIIESD